MLSVGFILEDEAVRSLVLNLVNLFSPEEITEILSNVSDTVSLYTVLTYPSQSNEPLPERYSWPTDDKLHKFASMTAQRGFFAALGSGKISVPYRRTGSLARSLKYTFTVESEMLIVSAIVPDEGRGFNPQWLLGTEDEQSLYFREHSGWNPLAVQLQATQPEILQVVINSLTSQIQDRLNGG